MEDAILPVLAKSIAEPTPKSPVKNKLVRDAERPILYTNTVIGMWIITQKAVVTAFATHSFSNPFQSLEKI